MIRNFALVIFIMHACVLTAKDSPKYIVRNIPAEMHENANAVYWEDRSFFQVYSKTRATHKVFRAVTILNAVAKDLSSVVVFYDKMSKISSIRGSIFNSEGELVKKLKPGEIYDQTMVDGNLYSDNRLKHMDLSHGAYPYTIEYEYEVEYKSLFYMPDYFQVEDEKIAVINARFDLVYPKDLKPRYTVNNLSTPPTVTTNENSESITWEFTNIKAMRREPLGPPLNELVPSISVAASTFEYQGYAGSMETWEEFGKWVNSLNKGRNVLNETTKQKIISLTKDIPTPEGKVKAVFEYMQNKTRYVSIQLGIGGYQPFEASVVDQNGYGDCKALSNYMVSMLDVIGIKANYVLVKSGQIPRKMNTMFPSPQFDHAVVCVPLEKDSIWLECTSQTIPFGYMGYHTANRRALAITPNGARIVHTPVYKEKDNLQIRTANVVVDEVGYARAKVKTTFSGLQYENGGLDEILGDTRDNQQKWIQNTTSIPSFDVTSFKFSNKKERIPTAIVELDLTLNRFATMSGKRLFLTPNLMNKSTFIPEKVEGRKTKIVLHSSFTDIDTVVFEMSDKIYPEFLPEPVKVSSRFGEYEASFALQQGKIIYVRRFVKRSGEFTAESYQELTDFYKAINKADHMKIVFLNKT